MKRTPITIHLEDFPAQFHPLLRDACVFDSSCSPEARVLFIDRDEGYYLKRASKGALSHQAAMTDYFHQKGLGCALLAYVSGDADWLLTAKAAGEDCTHPTYLSDPKRLCDTTATLLRSLHECDPTGCPIPDRTADYLAGAKKNFLAGHYDTSLSPDIICPGAEESFRLVESNAHLLKHDTLLHGDYCLPNILLQNWRFSAFIDLDGGGVGDRHIDLFWGAWTLRFNLHTDAYRQRFFDAYGKDKIDFDRLALVEIIERFG